MRGGSGSAASETSSADRAGRLRNTVIPIAASPSPGSSAVRDAPDVEVQRVRPVVDVDAGHYLHLVGIGAADARLRAGVGHFHRLGIHRHVVLADQLHDPGPDLRGGLVLAEQRRLLHRVFELVERPRRSAELYAGVQHESGQRELENGRHAHASGGGSSKKCSRKTAGGCAAVSGSGARDATSVYRRAILSPPTPRPRRSRTTSRSSAPGP